MRNRIELAYLQYKFIDNPKAQWEIYSTKLAASPTNGRPMEYYQKFSKNKESITESATTRTTITDKISQYEK